MSKQGVLSPSRLVSTVDAVRVCWCRRASQCGGPPTQDERSTVRTTTFILVPNTVVLSVRSRILTIDRWLQRERANVEGIRARYGAIREGEKRCGQSTVSHPAPTEPARKYRRRGTLVNWGPRDGCCAMYVAVWEACRLYVSIHLYKLSQDWGTDSVIRLNLFGRISFESFKCQWRH